MPRHQIDKLALYRNVVPAVEIAKTQRKHLRWRRVQLSDGRIVDQWDGSIWQDFLLAVEGQLLTVFDCRGLPIEFVEDAGDAAFHEAEQLREMVRLPYSECYFEFNSAECVYATETAIHLNAVLEDEGDNEDEEDEEHTLVSLQTLYGWGTHPTEDNEQLADTITGAAGEFRNGINAPKGKLDPTEPFFDTINSSLGAQNPVEEASLERAGRILLGMLSLLREKMLIETAVPDEAPRLSQARIKRGSLPVSGPRRVLTVNVPTVRRMARPVIGEGTHETPALHWRRGHWRVLHRGSEFENKTWVRKCLVGDPDKGFIRKDYRLTGVPLPVIRAPTMTPPTIVGA